MHDAIIVFLQFTQCCYGNICVLIYFYTFSHLNKADINFSVLIFTDVRVLWV